MKRFIALTLALALCASLLTCAASADAEQTVLRLAIATGMQEYFTLADNYMKENPDVKIEVEEYPTTEFSALTKAKLAGGDCWDVFVTFTTTLPTLGAGGHLADLSDMTEVIQRYASPESVLATHSVNGKVLGLPAQYQYLPVYYNKALFKDLGLEVPTNWQQFLAMIETAKAAGLIPVAAGFKDNWVGPHWIMQFLAIEVQRDDPNWGDRRYANETTFETTPGWAASFDRLKELIAVGAFSKSAVSTSDEQAMMAFLNGDALCFFSGTWDLGAMMQAQPSGFEFGALRLPTNYDGETACTATSVTGELSVWAKSPCLEEAKKFLAFTLSPEQNLILNSTKGPSPFGDVHVPLHPSLMEYEALIAESGGKVAEWAITQQRWPDGFYDQVIFPLTQELFYPELARDTPQILRELDIAWDEAVNY